MTDPAPSAPTPASATPDAPAPVPPTVKRIGWLHFANDFSLDFVTPLLPAGVPVAWLGFMEGAADGVAQVLKLATGRAADRSGKRAAWVAAGYGTNAVIRPLAGIGVLLGWPLWVVACRIGDRVGKGIRGSATDALVADWVSEGDRARTYARMRTLDHLGATAGALCAAAAVVALDRWHGQGLFATGSVAADHAVAAGSHAAVGWLILAMAVPALAMLWWCRGLRDAPRDAETVAAAKKVGWWPADGATRRLLLVVAVAGIGARLAPLLILAHVAGVDDPEKAWPLWLVCLGWGALALVQAGASSFAGWATDRLGARAFLVVGWLVGAAVFAALALASGPWLLAAGLGWGVLAGFTEGAEKTAVAAAVSKAERATAFGALGLLSAAAGLIGGAAVGFGLMRVGGPAFILPAAALALGAGLLLPSLRKRG